MDRDSIEWIESGRGRVDEMLREMRRIRQVRAAEKYRGPGKCSECGYEIGNLSFPSNCTYCGRVLTIKA